MSKLLVIDTETGGLDPQTHSILSLAGVVWDNGRLTDSVEVLIAEPNIVVTPEAMRVNRINLDQHRRHALAPQEALNRFMVFLEQHFGPRPFKPKIDLVGHNTHFDIAFVNRLFRFTNLQFEDMFSHRVLDTASIARFFILANKISISSAASSEAFRYFGIEVPEEKRHTALGDAIATAELFTKLLDLAKTCDVKEITH